jgi:DNA-binding SARP family transcriptional activator
MGDGQQGTPARASKLAPPLHAVTSAPASSGADEGYLADAGSEEQRPVVLSLLHGFELTVHCERVSLPWNAQRLLAFLALNRRPMLRLHVAGSLWLDKNEDRAGANLRSALWRLRQSNDLLVETDGGHLRLADTVAVDVRQAESLCRSILSEDPHCAEVLWADHLTGELLPDWYDDWVVMSRERLRQLFLHALERLCLRLCDAGRVAQAIDVGMRALAVDPLRESAHRALISAYLYEGNQSEALRQYELYRGILSEQLQLEPSEGITAMVRPLSAALA